MAVFVKDIARQVIANVGLESGYELAAQWVGQRYAELCSKAKFRHLRQYDQLYLRAPLTAGTVTITQDSTQVVGDATALAAWQANPFYGYPNGFTGLFFRSQQGQVWYRITEVIGNTLTLETPFAADNGSIFSNGNPASNIAYYILPRYVHLNPNARQLGVFVCDFMYRPLRLMSQDQLNVTHANRFEVWAYPDIIAELNNDLGVDGMPKVVEIYPWPVNSTTLHYTYWQTPQALALNDVVPPIIDPDILRDGATVDAMKNRMGIAIRKGNLEEAALWRNEYRTQETKWERLTARAIRNSRGADDLKFILKSGSWRGERNQDYDPITTAEQNFWARGF